MREFIFKERASAGILLGWIFFSPLYCLNALLLNPLKLVSILKKIFLGFPSLCKGIYKNTDSQLIIL